MFNVVIDKENAQNEKKKKASSAGRCTVLRLSHIGFSDLTIYVKFNIPVVFIIEWVWIIVTLFLFC